MTHVKSETAKRLAEAGFPQPKLPQPGLVFYGNSNKRSCIVLDSDLCCSYKKNGDRYFVEKYKIENLVFAPTATDILAHLPGWYLTFSNGEWACLSFDDEGSAPDSFVNDNPAEACAEAWFFKQATQKK